MILREFTLTKIEQEIGYVLQMQRHLYPNSMILPEMKDQLSI